MNWGWLDWVAVALIGGIVGTSELISRYKDDPSAAIRSWPARFYIAINAAASMGALGLIHANGWFGQARWTQILMAGVSAMAFFRTSLFVVRAGDRDVPVGPSGFLQIYLAAADRAVDRQRAAARSAAVVAAMKGVDYAKAKDALTAVLPGADAERLERGSAGTGPGAEEFGGGHGGARREGAPVGDRAD